MKTMAFDSNETDNMPQPNRIDRTEPLPLHERAGWDVKKHLIITAAAVLVILCGFITAVNAVLEKERGTIVYAGATAAVSSEAAATPDDLAEMYTGATAAVSSEAAANPDDLAEMYTGATVAVSSEAAAAPDDLAEMYAEYEPFGVTYDKTTDTLYFDGQTVRMFFDVLMTSPENYSKFSNGKFLGGALTGGISIRNAGSRDGGTIDVYVVRDFTNTDKHGNGTLVEIKKYSQEEFERHSNAGWTVMD
jgi:hypothetical protein